MKKMRRCLKHTAIMLCVCLLLGGAACNRSIENDGETYFGKIVPPEGQTLRYYTGAEPQTLDPQLMVGQPETRIAVALFDGLVEYDEKTVAPVPSLATNWDINADGTVWTFHLRRDARWSDGAPLNANDFVYSWRRALSPELAANNASMMYYIKNGESFNQMLAAVRDPATGKYATESDLERAGANNPVVFTAAKSPGDFAVSPVSTSPANANGNSSSTSASSQTSAQSNAQSNTNTQATAQNGAQTPAQSGAAASGTTTNNPAAKPEKYLFVPADKDDRDKLLAGDAAKKKAAKPELARFIEGKEIVPITAEMIGVRAADDYTFVVTLEAPTAFFVKTLMHQFFRPVPRQAIEKYGNQMWIKPANIVCSGAFNLTVWSPYDKIVVERNPMFWDNANTKLDRIIFPPTEELTTAMNMYKGGEVDAVQTNTAPPAWRRQLATKKDYYGAPYYGIEFVSLKTTMPPINDPRVRRAMSMAINREIIADQAPDRVPLTGFSPDSADYKSVRGTNYDPEGARKLLAEAGFPNGKGFPKIEIMYNTSESVKQTMEFIQSMLKRELNIESELTNVEWRVYLENKRSDKLNYKGIIRTGWIGDYVDPNSFLELMTSGSTNNGAGWKDAKYDQLFQAANAEIDPAQRVIKLQATEGYLLSQQPVIPLYVVPISIMTKPYVKGLEANLLDQHNWRGVYIDHDWQVNEQKQSGQQASQSDNRPLLQRISERRNTAFMFAGWIETFARQGAPEFLR